MFCLMQDRCKDELTMSVVSSFFLFVVVLIMAQRKISGGYA